MIIINLKGGLGNQLFQYALGYVLSKKYNEALYFDLSDHYKYSHGINQGIEQFQIDEMNLFQRPACISILTNRYVGAVTKCLKTFSIKLGSLTYVKEPARTYVESLPHSCNTYYDGYWQSSLYFSDYKNDLRKQFVPKEIDNSAYKLLYQIERTNSIAVHIRRGDFENKGLRKVGHLLPIEYYKNAIIYMEQNIESPEFYFFSDSPQFVKELLGEKDNYHFVSNEYNGNAATDMFLISKCRHGIMSASTFSWWGNWLRESEGIVLVPKKEYYNNHFYENEWIRIDF